MQLPFNGMESCRTKLAIDAIMLKDPLRASIQDAAGQVLGW